MDLNSAASFLKAHDNFIILTHRRPDGDTVGSAAALCRALRKLGKTAFVLKNSGISPKLELFTEGLVAPEGFRAEMVVAVDIADEKLFTLEAESFFGMVDLCIDHHPSNSFYAKNTLLDSDASATGLVVYRVIKELGVAFDTSIAEAIYLAASTDTGCFKYSNTTPECHRVAAECMEAGADFHYINTQFFVVKTPARLAVESEIFARLIMSDDGKIAISYLTREFVDRIQATADDMDNLSSLMMQVETAVCGILLTENTNLGTYRLSVRTREGASACEICLQFDGGGHARAAGGAINGKLQDCINRLMTAAREEIEKNV